MLCHCLIESTFLFQSGRQDTSNFDREFTKEEVKLTPTDKLFIMNLDQTEFANFSFANPQFVVHVWEFIDMFDAFVKQYKEFFLLSLSPSPSLSFLSSSFKFIVYHRYNDDIPLTFFLFSLSCRYFKITVPFRSIPYSDRVTTEKSMLFRWNIMDRKFVKW